MLTGISGAGYQWVIEGDIASYFDTIPHRRLLKAVKKRVADRDIRDLLWKFLRAGVMCQDTMKETLTGTPQGGIMSPLLANIYLHEMDRYMESKYLNLTNHQRRVRRKMYRTPAGVREGPAGRAVSSGTASIAVRTTRKGSSRGGSAGNRLHLPGAGLAPAWPCAGRLGRGWNHQVATLAARTLQALQTCMSRRLRTA